MSEPNHTPSPWKFEPGGGHAYNRIVGSDMIQVNGHEDKQGGSYSERICENLGNPELPGVAANIALISQAPELLETLEELVTLFDDPDYVGDSFTTQPAQAVIRKAKG